MQAVRFTVVLAIMRRFFSARCYPTVADTRTGPHQTRTSEKEATKTLWAI